MCFSVVFGVVGVCLVDLVCFVVLCPFGFLYCIVVGLFGSFVNLMFISFVWQNGPLENLCFWLLVFLGCFWCVYICCVFLIVCDVFDVFCFHYMDRSRKQVLGNCYLCIKWL